MLIKVCKSMNSIPGSNIFPAEFGFAYGLTIDLSFVICTSCSTSVGILLKSNESFKHFVEIFDSIYDYR